MTALDTLTKILETDILLNANLRYCLVGVDKRPYRLDGGNAKPNNVNDFVSLEMLCECGSLNKFAGIGISIQASKICAIDVDHCFSKPFDVSSADERAKDIIELFKKDNYIEFSFSGTGLRILFQHKVIEDYVKTYYIKNDKQDIEYYQPSNSYRYVTVTGNTIANNNVRNDCSNLNTFLEKYMKRPIIHRPDMDVIEHDERTLQQLLIEVKKFYFRNMAFQELWFGKAPGSNSNESQLDYHLLAELFENITQDKDKLRQLFELSPYYKSKDTKHIRKWEYGEHRYFTFMYNQLIGGLS